mgnify:CR=1 FL=1
MDFGRSSQLKLYIDTCNRDLVVLGLAAAILGYQSLPGMAEGALDCGFLDEAAGGLGNHPSSE